MRPIVRVLLGLVGGCGILFACVPPPSGESDDGPGSHGGGDSGSESERDAGASDAGEDGGSDAGEDGDNDAGEDGDNDAGEDGGNDAGEDAGNDAGADGGGGPACRSDGWTGVPPFGGVCPPPSGPIVPCPDCATSETQYFDTICPTGGVPQFRRFDTQHDPSACGGCNTKCTIGQVCLSGACASAANTRLATGFTKLEDIVVDANNLYVADSATNEVWQIDKATGGRTLLASNQASPYRIAIDATDVYWTNKTGGIARAPIGGASPATDLYPATEARGITVDGTHVYWTEATPSFGQLKKAPKVPGAEGCGAAGVHLSKTSSDYLFVDDARVYGFRGGYCAPSNHASVWGAGKDSAAESAYSVCSGYSIGSPLFTGLGVDSANVYFFDERGIDNLTLYRKDKATGAIQETRQICGGYMGMASCIPAPYVQLTVDGCGIYWAASDSLWRLLPADRVARRIFVGITSNPVTRIAVDDTYVYWADTSGYVGRVAK